MPAGHHRVGDDLAQRDGGAVSAALLPNDTPHITSFCAGRSQKTMLLRDVTTRGRDP